MKGILLAGGKGTRLYPMTLSVSKQLLPIYDKPLIYYPLSVLLLAGIRDILLISTPEDIGNYRRLLGDGSRIGVSIAYKEQAYPRGLADAFILGEEFIGNDSAALVLGDNIFHGSNFTEMLIDARLESEGIWSDTPNATVFGYYVNDPERYGVAEFDEFGHCISIEEKPKEPKSNYAVVGLYFYPNDVVEKAKQVKPSARGELEITALNQMYLEEGRLKIEKLPRGFAWLDTGTFDSLSQASNYVETIEKRTGQQIACLEEIGYNNDWLTDEDILNTAKKYKKYDYGKYLENLLNKTNGVE